MSYKEFLRRICPNYLPLRKLIARTRIKHYQRHIISAEEVIEGEEDSNKKQEIVEKYVSKWPDYISELNAEIEDIFEHSPIYKFREDKEDLKTDILFCNFAYGFRPKEYVSFCLENKNCNERRQYVSDVDRWAYVHKMNDMVDYMVLGDKWQTYNKFKPYYHRDVIEINTKSDFEKYMQFAEAHPVFVKKPVFNGKGEGVSLVDLSAIDASREQTFYDLIADGKHVLEEKVEQDGVLKELNGTSVNTVRCATLNTRHGIEIAFCFLRIGKEGMFVDNGSAGGIEVGINISTGRLDTDGYDYYGAHFPTHPASGVKFKEIELPDWQELLNLCKRMSSEMETVRFVCWDMAHTADGWVLIEGNNGGQMMGPQILYQKGIKSKMNSFLADMDLLA